LQGQSPTTLRQALPLPPEPEQVIQEPLTPNSLPLLETTGSVANGMREIRSAAASVITSPGLSAMREALATAHAQFAEVDRELGLAKRRAVEATRIYQGWATGWLFRRLLAGRFARLEVSAKDAVAEQAQLEEMLEQSRLSTQFEMPVEVRNAYALLVEAFEACMCSKRIWDNVAYRATNKVAERTVATRVLDLKPVSFKLGHCGVITSELPAPCLPNVNGGDLYVYPGFLVYLVSESTYALIELTEVTLKVSPMKFHEEGPVPSDATQVGTTWAKANKDGTPDKRFNNNYAIPVMRYATMTFQSERGLNEEFMLSNVAAAEQFERAWAALVQAVKTTSVAASRALSESATSPQNAMPTTPNEAVPIAGLAAYVLESKMKIDARAAFGLPEDAEPAAISAAMLNTCTVESNWDESTVVANIIEHGLRQFQKRCADFFNSISTESDASMGELGALFPLLEKTEEFDEYLERIIDLRQRIEKDGLSTLAKNSASTIVLEYRTRLHQK
jgi:hypothetical protein